MNTLDRTVTSDRPAPDASADAQTDLARYARAGDPEAFARVARRYHQMVFATCRRALGNDSDAEDASQEAFVRLARQAGQVRSNPGAWLHACALGTAIDLRRRRDVRRRAETHRVRHHAGSTPHRDDAAPGADSGLALWKDIEPLIDEALAALDPSDAEVIVQRYLVGRSQSELAAEMGVAAGTLSRRTRRALERIRAYLASHGVSVAAGTALGSVLTVSAATPVPAGAATGVAKIGIAGIGVAQAGGAGSAGAASLWTGKLGISAGIAAACGAVLIAGVALAPGMLGLSGAGTGTLGAAGASAVVAAADPDRFVDATYSGVERPRRPTQEFQLTSGAYPSFADASLVVGEDRLTLTLRRDEQSGRLATVEFDISRIRPAREVLEGAPEGSAVLETRVARTDLLPEMRTALTPGARVRLHALFDRHGRLEIRPLTEGIKLGRNEPSWYGVRPPAGWDEHAEIPRDAGPFGVLGPWAAAERWPVVLTPEEIRFGAQNWQAAAYRIIAWEEGADASRISAIYAGGYDQRLIGTRYGMLFRRATAGDARRYELAVVPADRVDVAFPESFTPSDDNPVQVFTFAEGW